MALSLGAYLVGAAELAAIVAALYYGAVGLRRWALSGWSGPPALLAEAVLAIAMLVWVVEVLGAVGALDEWPLVAASVIAGLGAGFAARSRVPGGAEGQAAPPAPRVGRVAWIVAGVVVALLFAQWAGRTQLSLDRGMYGFDTTWYHMPFAARFAQQGSITPLHFTSPAFLSWFYPANSELLHSVGILTTSRDIVSPILNLGWLALALLAAWCVGRPFGVGPASLVGAAVVLGGGVFADQPGEARNDIVGLALLLAAAALLINGCAASTARTGNAEGGAIRLRLGTGPLAIAGIAAGLALGTKLTLASPVAALTVGVVVASPAGRRVAMGGTWIGALAAAGGFWFARNLIASGNPVPWVTSIGPISLPGPEEVLPSGREPFSVAHYATDTSVWREWFFPALADGFGVLWPAVLAAAALGAVLCLVRGRGEAATGARPLAGHPGRLPRGRGGDSSHAAVRVVGFAAVAAAIAYSLTPLTASGSEGEPVGFASNLRYLAPVLALSLALLPVAVARSRDAWGGAVLAALALGFALALVRSDAWDAASLRAALLGGAAVAGVLCVRAAALAGRLRGAPIAVGATVAVAVALAGGYFEQRNYLDDRYATPSGAIAEPGQDSAFAWARDVHGADIGTITIRQYPLYGTDLSNHVQYVGRRGSDDSFIRIESCRGWRRALNAGGYDYVMTGLNFPTANGPKGPPEAAWTGNDPAAKPVLRDGSVSVFRLDARLRPGRC
jgi:hypothetical protein